MSETLVAELFRYCKTRYGDRPEQVQWGTGSAHRGDLFAELLGGGRTYGDAALV